MPRMLKCSCYIVSSKLSSEVVSYCLQEITLQTRSSVTTRLSFWHLFYKFLISLVNSSISLAYRMQKTWNRSLSTTEFWKNLLLCKKLNLTKIWAGIKFIYRQYAFVSILIKSRPLPTLKFDKHTYTIFHHVFIGPFQTGSHQTNQKLVKKVSILTQVVALECVWM